MYPQHPRPSLTLPLADPLALIDATALFVIQVLIAQHPELLVEAGEQPGPTLHHRRHRSHVHTLFTAVQELQFAVETYRTYLHALDDDIPF